MPEVSAAIIVLAGAVLMVAGAIPSSMTDSSRQRVAGIGYLLAAFGFLAWIVAYIMELVRLNKIQ